MWQATQKRVNQPLAVTPTVSSQTNGRRCRERPCWLLAVSCWGVPCRLAAPGYGGTRQWAGVLGRIWARGPAARLSGLHSGAREPLLQPLLGTNAASRAFLPHARQQADRDRMQAIWWKGGAQQLD